MSDYNFIQVLDTVKTVALTIVGGAVTLGLAYIAARWHKTPPGAPPSTPVA